MDADTERRAARPGWLDWMPALSLTVVLAGALLVGGGWIRDVEDHTRRLDKLDTLDQRLTSIEAKVDMLVQRDRQREARP